MKFKNLLAIMAFISASLVASASYALGITGITAPASAAQGAPVSVTVNGTGGCGGYTINWGDTNSNAVGLVVLPHVPPSHSYTTTGTKTINVTPGAGCTGSASTTIQINQKPLVGHIIPFSKITSISGSATARWGRTYKMKVLGNGKCKLRIDWGDGGLIYNANNYNLSAPAYLYHKFNSPGTKTIKVTAAPVVGFNTCSGSASKSVRVSLFSTAPKPAKMRSPGVRRELK